MLVLPGNENHHHLSAVSMSSRASSLLTARTASSPLPAMNTETSITLGVALRVIVNILCVQNVKLGAAILGVWDGLLIHRSWLENRLFNPETIFLLLAGFAFDHIFFGSLVRTVTLVLGCGLGILLGDIGPDLWYEIGGDKLLHDMQQETDSLLAAVPFLGDASDDEGSVITRTTRAPTRVSSRTSRTSRTGTSRTGTSVTIRPSRIRRTPRAEDVQSGTTRLSRVTFDESSISQTHTSSSSSESEPEEETVLATTEPDDMYMEPSTMGSQPSRGRSSSVLRRLYIPGQDSPVGISVQSTSAQSHTSHGDEETTPRAHIYEFSPLPPSATVPPPFVYGSMPPNTSSRPQSMGTIYQQGFPQPRTPSYQDSRPQSTHISPANQTPVSFPEPHRSGSHSPSRLSRLMNVPIADPQLAEMQGSRPPSPSSVRSRSRSPLPLRPPAMDYVDDPSRYGSNSRPRSREPSPNRSRPPSPAGPRPQSPRPSVQETDMLSPNSESL